MIAPFTVDNKIFSASKNNDLTTKRNRALADQSRTIRIPVHMKEMLSKLYKFSRKHRQDSGTDPTVEEYSKYLKMSAEKVRTLLRIVQEPVSLAMPVGDDDDSLRGGNYPFAFRRRLRLSSDA